MLQFFILQDKNRLARVTEVKEGGGVCNVQGWGGGESKRAGPKSFNVTFIPIWRSRGQNGA